MLNDVTGRGQVGNHREFMQNNRDARWIGEHSIQPNQMTGDLVRFSRLENDHTGSLLEHTAADKSSDLMILCL